MPYVFYFHLCPIYSRDSYVASEQHIKVSNTLRQNLSRA